MCKCTDFYAIIVQFAEKVIADVTEKRFRFNVDDDTLLADNAYDRNKDNGGPVKIIEGDSPVATPLVDVILAVVFSLVLIIVIVVVVVIIAVCYR